MAALSGDEDEAVPMDSLLERLEHGVMLTFGLKHLPPLFRNQEEYAAFNRRHAQAKVQRGDLATYSGKCYLGIDAGSTTTKVALIGEKGELLYSYYAGNSGSPIETARMASVFEEDQSRSHPLTPAEWFRRPRSRRVAESLMRVFSPLL